MAQVEARDTSTDTLYLLGMASGQGDRDSREAFLPLAKGEERIARNYTDENMARRIAEESSWSTRVAAGEQEEDGLCHRSSSVPTKDSLKF